MRSWHGSILRARAGAGRIPRIFRSVGVPWLVLVSLTVGGMGCRGAIQPVAWSELGTPSRTSRPNSPAAESRPRKESRQNKDGLRIVARSTTQVAQLSPADIVRIMRRVGFSDAQILDLGTDLHNALLLSGGAEVYYGKRVEMCFAIQDGQIQIQSATRGSFVYDLAKRCFVLGAVPSGR